MKKFYLSLLALVCTIGFTASATGLEKTKKVVAQKTFETVAEPVQMKVLNKVSKKAPASRAGIASLDEIAGNYTWQCINLFEGKAVSYEVAISVNDASTNSLLIEGLYGGADLLGVADLAAGTISIAPVKVGYDAQYQEDLIFVTCENIGTQQQANIVPTDADLVLTYTVDEDGAYFASESIYGIVGRDSAGNYTNADGYYYLSQYAIVERAIPWDLVGTAKVSGDVLFTSFGKTPADYEVDVLVSPTDPNLYRVKDFLKGLYAALGFDGVSPDFDIDATDANNIVLGMTSTGINGGTTDGIYYYTSTNQNYETNEDCPEEFRGKLTVTDQTVIFSFPVKGTLLYASTSNQLYYGNTTPITITITKATEGVENITIDDANAPAEFFNLQGQRVAAPVKGNLYIKRQGTVTSKVVF